MPHRFVRQFLNNEKIIQQMADSHGFRRAARLFVSVLYSGRNLIEGTSIARRLKIFTRTFKSEYTKSIRDK